MAGMMGETGSVGQPVSLSKKDFKHFLSLEDQLSFILKFSSDTLYNILMSEAL